jgi:hypothetical protein
MGQGDEKAENRNRIKSEVVMCIDLRLAMIDSSSTHAPKKKKGQETEKIKRTDRR